MRILLATEGPSDEIVARKLLQYVLGPNVVEPKRFPARGFPIVERLISQFVRAGHFGHYELLIVHFDLDSTLPRNSTNLSESVRWKAIRERITNTLRALPVAHRTSPLEICMMTPCRSTEAWLAWGRDGGRGQDWEQMDQHQLKRALFGNPPRGLVVKSEILTAKLLPQMNKNEQWPVTLRAFVQDLRRFERTRSKT